MRNEVTLSLAHKLKQLPENLLHETCSTLTRLNKRGRFKRLMFIAESSADLQEDLFPDVLEGVLARRTPVVSPASPVTPSV